MVATVLDNRLEPRLTTHSVFNTGEQLYDVAKLDNRIRTMVEPVYEAQKLAALVDATEKPLDSRYEVDIFTSRGMLELFGP